MQKRCPKEPCHILFALEASEKRVPLGWMLGEHTRADIRARLHGRDAQRLDHDPRPTTLMLAVKAVQKKLERRAPAPHDADGAGPRR
jgi:hypothetical protein